MANKEVKLKDGNDYLFPQAMLNGIDVNNKLSEYTNPVNTNMVASEDCMAIITIRDHCGTFKLDGVELGILNARAGNYGCNLIVYLPMKKGQVLRNEFERATNCNVVFYGIKH